MRPALYALLLALATAAGARAERPAPLVHPKTTVEVVDAHAKIDDVITRLRKHPPRPEARPEPEAELQHERPRLPEPAPELVRASAHPSAAKAPAKAPAKLRPTAAATPDHTATERNDRRPRGGAKAR